MADSRWAITVPAAVTAAAAAFCQSFGPILSPPPIRHQLERHELIGSISDAHLGARALGHTYTPIDEAHPSNLPCPGAVSDDDDDDDDVPGRRRRRQREQLYRETYYFKK